MPDYRRWHTGRFVFLTVVTSTRQRLFYGELARQLLREALEEARQRWPWRTRAMVLLPDHLHALWELPEDDLDYSRRIVRWKGRFTSIWLAAGDAEADVPAGQRRKRLRGVWQQRFLEHTIRDPKDYPFHLDYIRTNPVKHGLANQPADWPWSSFHRYVREGQYDPQWNGRVDLPGSTEYAWIE